MYEISTQKSKTENNGQRIALRMDGVLTYLHNDHLSSTVLETNSSGGVIRDQTYLAYGKQRDSGKVVTDHRFTGQKSDGSGLMYYQSRYYDPSTGLFVSPDMIVPDAGLVSDYNRFAYARGNARGATTRYISSGLSEIRCAKHENSTLYYI